MSCDRWSGFPGNEKKERALEKTFFKIMRQEKMEGKLGKGNWERINWNE